MDSVTFAIWFAVIWICIVLLYCLFRVCGGRLADILSCRCFSGPLCSCWGVGGRLEQGDTEYPFSPYDPYFAPPPQQLPLVVINTNGDGDDASGDNMSDVEDGDALVDDDGESEAVRALRASDENRRTRSDGALLLQNQNKRVAAAEGPVVV